MGFVNEEVVFKSNNRCFTTSVITLDGLSILAKQLSRLLSARKMLKPGHEVFIALLFFSRFVEKNNLNFYFIP